MSISFCNLSHLFHAFIDCSCSYCLLGYWRKKSCPRFWQEAQDSKEEEKERPQRATKASVSICPFLQGHTSCNQRTEPECYIWRCFKNSGIYVGQFRRRTKTGKLVQDFLTRYNNPCKKNPPTSALSGPCYLLI